MSAASAPEHTPEAHDVIACELAACILGQRRHADRLELRVDVVGQIARIARMHRALQEEIGARLVEALAPLVRALGGRTR
jgi:hypothetical protein